MLYGLGLIPPKIGFLTMEDPEGFIGHHVPLVTPGTTGYRGTGSQFLQRIGF